MIWKSEELGKGAYTCIEFEAGKQASKSHLQVS